MLQTRRHSQLEWLLKTLDVQQIGGALLLLKCSKEGLGGLGPLRSLRNTGDACEDGVVWASKSSSSCTDGVAWGELGVSCLCR